MCYYFGDKINLKASHQVNIITLKHTSYYNVQWSLQFKTTHFNNSLHFKTGLQCHWPYIFNINISLYIRSLYKKHILICRICGVKLLGPLYIVNQIHLQVISNMIENHFKPILNQADNSRHKDKFTAWGWCGVALTRREHCIRRELFLNKH